MAQSNAQNDRRFAEYAARAASLIRNQLRWQYEKLNDAKKDILFLLRERRFSWPGIHGVPLKTIQEQLSWAVASRLWNETPKAFHLQVAPRGNASTRSAPQSDRGLARSHATAQSHSTRSRSPRRDDSPSRSRRQNWGYNTPPTPNESPAPTLNELLAPALSELPAPASNESQPVPNEFPAALQPKPMSTSDNAKQTTLADRLQTVRSALPIRMAGGHHLHKIVVDNRDIVFHAHSRLMRRQTDLLKDGLTNYTTVDYGILTSKGLGLSLKRGDTKMWPTRLKTCLQGQHKVIAKNNR
ncbi:hypothetical protein OPT61_g8977 [Boeremia exigua]|uniref:Uncharacterized protein n=1 Tax=Boeremia exigua TaxID=749465 RepID=A0ACC2HX20_9PLEO|nr:hypothetical protein OPT61_g8977 [Boeremia exigua]